MVTPGGQFTKCDFFFFRPLICPVLRLIGFCSLLQRHLLCLCENEGVGEVVFWDPPCPMLGRGNWVRGFLASSGLHLVGAFTETLWGPWHCAVHEAATDSFPAAEIGLTQASSMGS